MQIINIPHKEIKLVGIKIRTNNKAELEESSAKIGSMVYNYFQNGISNQISHKNNPEVTYIAYTDYESDHLGEYTCFIGTEVIDLSDITSGLSTHIIPDQNYIKFTTASGSLPDIVIDTWKEIWQMEELNNNRSYLSDFEVYDARAADPSNAVMNIYIGVK